MRIILNIIGWAIVFLSIAFVVRNSRDKISAKDLDTAGVQPRLPDANQKNIGDVCSGIEFLTRSAAMIFDNALKLIAIGNRAREIIGKEKIAERHLVDIIPLDAAAPFLRGISFARQNGIKSWECLWNGKNISATAARAGELCIVVVQLPSA